MNNFSNIDLVELATNPPVIDMAQIGDVSPTHRVHGPIFQLPDDDGGMTLSPIVDNLMEIENPFILWSYNESGETISVVWDGSNTDIYYEDGHITRTVTSDKTDFITCKWYAPSERDMNEDSDIFLHEDYLFDKAFPEIKQCTNPNPNMGVACGFPNHQPLCGFYESEIVKTPVHFKDKNSINSFKIREARVNNGTKVVQIIEEINDEITITTHKISEMSVETLTNQALECASNNFQELEEVEVVSLRESFIKGIMKS